MGMTPKMIPTILLVQALDHIVQTARRYGVAPGIHTADHEAAARRMAQGFQFVAVASDAG